MSRKDFVAGHMAAQRKTAIWQKGYDYQWSFDSLGNMYEAQFPNGMVGQVWMNEDVYDDEYQCVLVDNGQAVWSDAVWGINEAEEMVALIAENRRSALRRCSSGKKGFTMKRETASKRDFIAGYMAALKGVKASKNASRKKAGWGDFSNPVADRMNEMFLPSYGDGENMANQIATAVNKLVYKWFNDGDVFDNVHTGLEGFANDISGSANWLYRYVPDSKPYLERAFEPISEAEYESILYDLFHATLCDEDLMLRYSELPKVGDAYDEDGPFSFDYNDPWEDEDDDYYW